MGFTQHTKLHVLYIGVFLFLFGILSVPVLGQNSTEATYHEKDISKINVNGNEIFKISVETSQADQITIKSLTDGEYQNNFKVVSKVVNGQLNISLKRISLHTTPDDKRNAHKVIAATLKLHIPTDKDLTITSNIGSVDLTGNYNLLAIKLEDGNCTFNGTAKTAQIETRDGYISIKTKDALIETDSHHGLVNIPNDMFGYNVYKLKTHGGNVTVTKL